MADEERDDEVDLLLFDALIRRALKQGFMAGYHATWDVDNLTYRFEPSLKPGDPEGAWKAWQHEFANDPWERLVQQVLKQAKSTLDDT